MKENQSKEWLLFIYKVPKEPSTQRVKVWRKLKDMGAFYIQQSVAIMPYFEEAEKEILQIALDIRNNGGESYAFTVHNISDKDREILITNFNRQRDEEYQELIEKCEDFLKEIQKETERENFTFAELEENDEELDKLERWYEKIYKRDFFYASKRESAIRIIQECENALKEFSIKIYQREGMA
ncbi:Chromate resistance protein ChrB [Thermovenabulum sp.]|uniref:Chromate resistance protein ChrB n=1 Tax=Thermovenabulum sp. TaxID=3100335 RepID=UPI003C7B7CCB